LTLKMSSIEQVQVPNWALLKTYRATTNPQAWDDHDDCFTSRIDRPVALPDFVFAFYTGEAFRVERWILRFAVNKPSSDDDVRALAAGSATQFSAWVVRQRTDTQLLLEDFQGSTRSWLAVTTPSPGTTLLHFGSGIKSVRNAATGAPEMSRGFRWLSGFHTYYSRVLLGAARRRLLAGVALERITKV
jgi:hypothetical protein